MLWLYDQCWLGKYTVTGCWVVFHCPLSQRPCTGFVAVVGVHWCVFVLSPSATCWALVQYPVTAASMSLFAFKVCSCCQPNKPTKEECKVQWNTHTSFCLLPTAAARDYSNYTFGSFWKDPHPTSDPTHSQKTTSLSIFRTFLTQSKKHPNDFWALNKYGIYPYTCTLHLDPWGYFKSCFSILVEF